MCQVACASGAQLKSADVVPLFEKDIMTLSQTTDAVKRCMDSMNARYGRPVFNEWAIVSLQKERERVVAYHGPRKELFHKNFVQDLGSLRAQFLTTRHDPGYFDFARHAVGTDFEAFICVGEHLYLICNHTESTMHEIAKDARWLDAQRAFAELTEKFRLEPLAA